MPDSCSMSSVTEGPAQPVSPRARRLTPARWLDLRLIVGLALVLGSVLLGASVVASARRTAAVVGARRDLAAGTVLTADDLALLPVRLPAVTRSAYGTDPAAIVGKQLARPVTRGELVPLAALTAVPARTTLTVPLAADAAPELAKGDRIELWVVADGCPSTVLLRDVAVQAVRADSGGGFATGSAGQDVVISVAPEVADRVVDALTLDGVRLRAGVLAGPPVADPAGGPPDLTECATAAR
jgi:SAF domain